jgi:hypothetical protein
LFLVIAILVGALAVGLLAGGSLRSFERVHMHWWGIAALGLLVQVVPAPNLDSRSRLMAGLIVATSYGLLMAFIAVNRRAPAALLMFIGLAMNLVVVGLNGGMPVSADAIRAAGGESFQVADGRHHLATDEDVLVVLGDTIPVPGLGVVLSPGDVVLYAGVAWFVVAVMLGRFRENRRPPPRVFQRYRGKHESARSRAKIPVTSLPTAGLPVGSLPTAGLPAGALPTAELQAAGSPEASHQAPSHPARGQPARASWGTEQ